MMGRILSGLAVALLCGSSGSAWSNEALQYLGMDDQTRQGGLWVQFQSTDEVDKFTRFSEPGRELERSTLSMNQQFGDQTLHWGVSQAEDERLDQLGISFGKSSVYGFSGFGDTTSKNLNPYSGIGSFQFHGGLRQRFEFSGYRLGYRFNQNNGFELTHVLIKAPGLEDRTVYDLGWRGRRMQLSMGQVDVGDQIAGRTMSLGIDLGKHRWSLQGLDAANRASFLGLAYSTRTRKGKDFAINLERRQNPLYEAANDDRITFSLGFRFGARVPVLYASEAEAEETPEQKKKVSPVLVGAAAVGAGVALSSGSSGADGQTRFAGQNEPARQVLNGINPTSVAQNREFGGYVYRNADGSFSATQPIPGEAASVSLPPPASAAPQGAVTTASYHTHAAFDPRFDNENFSPQDIISDILFRIDGYLGTPAGQFKFFDLSSRQITTLGGPGTLATGS